MSMTSYHPPHHSTCICLFFVCWSLSFFCPSSNMFIGCWLLAFFPSGYKMAEFLPDMYSSFYEINWATHAQSLTIAPCLFLKFRLMAVFITVSVLSLLSSLWHVEHACRSQYAASPASYITEWIMASAVGLGVNLCCLLLTTSRSWDREN